MKILITGSSEGIGKGAALRFLQHPQAQVIGLDVLPATIEHERYAHIISDVAEPSQLPEIDGITHLINNAGVQNSGRDIAVNLQGLMRCTERYGLQPAIEAIINIASASAHSGAEFPEYVASKGGVVAYTKWTALEIAKYGATCNSLSPGGVLTALNQPVMDDPEKWQAIMDETLLPKWASVEEVAEWIYFLAVINKSMTAQDVLIDNGEMAKSNFVW